MSSSVPLYRIVFAGIYRDIESAHTRTPVPWGTVVKRFHDAQQGNAHLVADGFEPITYRVVAA